MTSAQRIVIRRDDRAATKIEEVCGADLDSGCWCPRDQLRWGVDGGDDDLSCVTGRAGQRPADAVLSGASRLTGAGHADGCYEQSHHR